MSIKHAAAGIAAIVGLGAFLQQPQQPVDLTARVAALEKRVGTLEQFHVAPAGAPAVETKPAVGEFIVPVTVTNKRYQPADIMNGVVQDAVWWDSTYDFSKLEKPARAIKGELEFRDLFDAPKFALNVTITDPVPAHGEAKQEGHGFHFNQFLASHAWMRTTEVKDMHIVFHVKQVIYADGTRVEFK